MRSLSFVALAAICGSSASAQQAPIHLIFDLHVDPFPVSGTYDQSRLLYESKNDNMLWVLDQVEPLDLEISFLSGGQWMEFVIQDGALGTGAGILRRMYDLGGQVGTHTHAEYRVGPFQWETLADATDLTMSALIWQQARMLVDQGIMVGFAGSPPESIALINSVRGSHAPDDEEAFHDLMQTYGYGTREPGPEEDYYGWYGHHIWHPFRPSAANYMAEDLSAYFVQVTQGPVIGMIGPHHGVMQDMRAETVKRQFLQLYINWRLADRSGAPEKVWSWGWGSHARDYDLGSDTRTDLLDVVAWIGTNFQSRVEPTGSPVMEWSTHRDAATDYMAWETRNPGVSSFSFDSLTVDWDEYPWLRTVAEEMVDLTWTEDMALPSGVTGFRLTDGSADHLLLFLDVGTATLDLSGEFPGEVRMLSLESGLEGTYPSNAVPVTIEAVLVEAAPSDCASPTVYCSATVTSTGTPASISWSGTPSHTSNDFVLRVSGAPANQPGIFYFGDAQTEVPFGHGVRCVAGTVRRLPPVTLSPTGHAEYALDLTTPMLAAACAAGSTQNFQFWLRDPAAGSPGFNLSDGLSVLFCP
jgi:hypothetical protein